MKATKEELKALTRRLKACFTSSTSRIGEGSMALSKSIDHIRVISDVSDMVKTIISWDGPLEEIESRVSGFEAKMSVSLAAADEKVSLFPPGSGLAFGHTYGLPRIEGGVTDCHFCGRGIEMDAKDRRAIFLKMSTGTDVLLFVRHATCRPIKEKNSVFQEIPRRDFMELLAAKAVLSA